MRRHLSFFLLAFLVLEVLAACGPTPPRRLPDYLGGRIVDETTPLPSDRPIHAALAVIADTSAPDAAPPLPDAALIRLTDYLKEEVSQRLPIAIDSVIPAQDIRGRDIQSLVEAARRHGAEYLLFVVASATEQEYPMTLFLGWVTHAQPGWRRDNWSLLEAVLLDAKAERVLLEAEGRGWATLDRPSAPGINQWYPVVWLRPNDPGRRYWPPTYEGAPNTLRVIAMREAAKRQVLNLQEAWIHKRQTEIDAPITGAPLPAS